MAYEVIGPDTAGCNFSDFMVVDEDVWADYASDKVNEFAFMGPFTSLNEAEMVRDRLNKAEIEFTPYLDDDDAEEETITNPGDFDGGYGEDSYYWRAMNKDD
jgi:hypothetical protein